MALVVLTGGARSGKSAVAERLAADRGGEVVVAVFGDGDGDEEMAERIEKHRADRSAEWRVVERPDPGELSAAAGEGALLVVDCLGTLVSQVMASEWPAGAHGTYGEPDSVPAEYAVAVENRVGEIVEGLVVRQGDTLVVTNEVGGGVVPAYALGRLFRDVLGRANRALVAHADAAWLVVAGRCLDLVALPRDARWPVE